MPRYYMYSDNDNAIIPQLQKDMVAEQGVNGTFFISGSDHEPHLSKPLEVARVLSTLAGEDLAMAPGGAPGPSMASTSGQNETPKAAAASQASSGVLAAVLALAHLFVALF